MNKKTYSITKTHADTHCHRFFASCAALGKAKDVQTISLFANAFRENPEKALRILLYLRDEEAGMGDAKSFGTIMKHLAYHHPDTVNRNFDIICKYADTEELLFLINTKCREKLIELVARQIKLDVQAMKNGQSVSGIANRLSTLRELGGRRKDTAQSICAATGMTAAEYDKSIFALREWIIKTEATYAPGEKDVAPLREKCITQITPDLPCGIVRAAAYCDDAQTIARLGVLWAAFKHSTEHANAITVPDFSDSMLQTSDSGVRPIDIAASLAIFTAQTCNGHFANKFITFSGAPRTIELRGNDLAEKAEYCTAHKSSERLRLCDVLLTILEEAVAAELPEEELPRFVYVVSDMALEAGTAFGERLMENARKLYRAHGYTLPEIIYWNVDGKEDTFGARLDANGIIQVRGASDTLIRKVFNHRISLKSIMRSILTSSRYRASDRCA